MGSLVDKNKYIKGVLFYASSLQLVSAPSATFLRCLLVTLNLIIKLMVARINDTFCSMHVQPYGEMKVKNSVIILGKLLPKHNSSEQPPTTFYTKIFFTCYTECILANVAFPLDSSQIKTF